MEFQRVVHTNPLTPHPNPNRVYVEDYSPGLVQVSQGFAESFSLGTSPQPRFLTALIEPEPRLNYKQRNVTYLLHEKVGVLSFRISPRYRNPVCLRP